MPYAVATALGMIPAIVLYTILGHQIAEGAMGGGRDAFVKAAVVGGAIVLLSLVPALVKRKTGTG